ncbi:MAG: RecX family transcriptional regulator [Prevotella sp.]|nr:RecX family transcriptional regulator [Prevotella sp.]
MKPITEQEALSRLSLLCSQAEHCTGEMLEKMRRWQLDDAAQARIMQRLTEGRYIDDERYARAFVRDKVRFGKWGRRKIEQALWQKRIADDIREQVLNEVSDDEYLCVLRPLIAQKRRTTRAASDYELNAKLIRFAAGRGFTMDIIRQCLNVNDEDEFLE